MKKNNCILCQSSNKSVIARQTFEDEYLTLINSKLNKVDRAWVECNDCKLIFHDPQLEEFETDILYKKFRELSFRGEAADEYFDRIISMPKEYSDNQFKVTWLYNNIKDYLNKGGSVLDIGSGGGVYLYTFLQRNKSWIPYCIEPTAEFANLSKRRLKGFVHLGNYYKDIFDKKFDLIICNQVLEHIIDPMEFLSDIFSDLIHGGYLYIEVPDPIDFNVLAPEHDRFLSQHLWYFSIPILENMFEETGFKIKKIESQKLASGKNNLVAILFKE